MFNMKKIPWVGIAFMLMSLGWVSCVDNKYDLDKDIDWTISAGGEYLAIPVGSTDTAFLSKIIDVEEDGMLAVNGNHEYHLTKQDDIAVEPTSVEKVEIEEIDSDLDPVTIVGEGMENRGAHMFSTEVRAKVETTGKFEKEVIGVDAALKELGSLIAEVPSVLTVSFNFSSEGGLTYDEVRSENLVLIFPDFLQFEENQLVRDNRLDLSDVVLSSSPSETKEISLKVKGYKFSDKAGGSQAQKPVDGTFSILGEIKTEGFVRTTGVQNAETGRLDLALKTALNPMTVNQVIGVIQPEINVDDTDIELNGLPEFLKDEDTRLDLTNPVFMFKATNNLKTEVVIDVVMTPQRAGKDLSQNTVTVTGLQLAPEAETLIALSRTGESGIAGAQDKKVDDMNKLMEVIPDFISVALDPRVENDQYYEAELGVDYEMPSSYDVDVPLSFESGLNIVYKDSISDLNKDLSDLDKVDFNVANLIFNVVNTIPLQMEIKPENVEIKDVYGNMIQGILVESDGNKIAESKDGKEEVESEFTLKLTSDEPGVLSRIERICFKVTAVPGQATSVPLKDTQWLKMTKIKLNVPGGVKVDLN